MRTEGEQPTPGARTSARTPIRPTVRFKVPSSLCRDTGAAIVGRHALGAKTKWLHASMHPPLASTDRSGFVSRRQNARHNAVLPVIWSTATCAVGSVLAARSMSSRGSRSDWNRQHGFLRRLGALGMTQQEIQTSELLRIRLQAGSLKAFCYPRWLPAVFRTARETRAHLRRVVPWC